MIQNDIDSLIDQATAVIETVSGYQADDIRLKHVMLEAIRYADIIFYSPYPPKSEMDKAKHEIFITKAVSYYLRKGIFFRADDIVRRDAIRADEENKVLQLKAFFISGGY